MKTTYKTILGLLIAAVVLLAVVQPCNAVEKKEKSFEEAPKGPPRWIDLTDEAIERIMGRLAETEPAKAEELAKLRNQDPEKFKAELRAVMRQQFRERRGQVGEGGFSRGLHAGPGGPGPGRGPTQDRRHGFGPGAGMLGEKHSEYLEWLEKNYPEKAEKLAELREAKPELYNRHLGLGMRRYGRIAEAAKENPELAEVLKESLELKRTRDELLAKIKTSTDDAEKAELTRQLKDVVSNRFDLILRRKQIEYESMLKKLEQLKEQVEKSKTEVDKWKDVKFKEDRVKTRIEELMSRTEKFRWD
jgi:hypothetical protein